MSNPDRLSGLDASFLHLERGSAHMHVGSVLIFEGEPPSYPQFVEHVERRLSLVPRYRQRLAFVPLQQGRPVWVDDPHFNVEYHIRHSSLPRPGSDAKLKRLAGRLFSQELDRDKPLWEIWLISGLSGDRFSLVAKTHHCLVDGVSGVDITAVLFDTTPEPPPMPPVERWTPKPPPSGAQLLADALLERATEPAEAIRGLRALTRAPRQALGALGGSLGAVGALMRGGTAAPPTPLNAKIGPHRRFTWVDGDLRRFKAIKNALGGTVNDAILTSVALGLGRYLRAHDFDTDGVTLRAMVPVSVRADVEQGALGNRVAAMWAPLPVDVEDPIACFEIVHDAMDGLKESGQAVGAQVLTELTGFAPPTIMAQAARLQSRQRFFNLVVTNVPGPQFRLYVLGRPLTAFYPQVPLAQNQGLGIAIMSYDGSLFFGLLGDWDVMEDLESLARELAQAIDALARTAGAPAPDGRPVLGISMPRNRPQARTRRTASRQTR